MKNRSKILIRRVMRDRASSQRESHSSTISPILAVENWPKKWQDIVSDASIIAGYMPLWDELSLEAFWQSPLVAHCRKCFPRVEGDEIVFYECTNSDSMRKGSFGIMEPSTEERIVDPSEISIMLIPASAYGQDGTRLGRGKGFYDCYFASMLEKRSKSDFTLIGVVRSEALLQALPSDPWDLKADAVVTESFFVET